MHRVRELERKVKDLEVIDAESKINGLEKAVKALEDWKTKHEAGYFTPDILRSDIYAYQVIDKQVWMEIKDATHYLRQCLLEPLPVEECHPTKHLSELEDAIKKADPTFNVE